MLVFLKCSEKLEKGIFTLSHIPVALFVGIQGAI
jgi:hypothetical protein